MKLAEIVAEIEKLKKMYGDIFVVNNGKICHDKEYNIEDIAEFVNIKDNILKVKNSEKIFENFNDALLDFLYAHVIVKRYRIKELLHYDEKLEGFKLTNQADGHYGIEFDDENVKSIDVKINNYVLFKLKTRNKKITFPLPLMGYFTPFSSFSFNCYDKNNIEIKPKNIIYDCCFYERAGGGCMFYVLLKEFEKLKYFIYNNTLFICQHFNGIFKYITLRSFRIRKIINQARFYSLLKLYFEPENTGGKLCKKEILEAFTFS